MRLIDADKLIKGRGVNDPVRIAAMCKPTAFDKTKVLRYLKARKEGAVALGDDFNAGMETAYRIAIEIVARGGVSVGKPKKDHETDRWKDHIMARFNRVD